MRFLMYPWRALLSAPAEAGETLADAMCAYLAHAGVLERAAAERALATIVRRLVGGPTFDPRSYGARGDGVADDSGAFVRADADAAVAGGSVVVPPGTYALADVHQRVPWLGAGGGAATLLHRPGSRGDGHMVLGSSDLLLVGLTLAGNRAAQRERTRLYSFDGNGRSLFVRDCRFTNSVAGALDAVRLSATVEVARCTFDDIGAAVGVGDETRQGNAIYSVGSPAGALRVLDSTFRNAPPADAARAPCAIHVAGGSPASRLQVTIERNVIERFGCASSMLGAIDVYEFAAATSIADNRIRAPYYSGIKVANSAPVTIARNHVFEVRSGFGGALIAWSGNLRRRGRTWGGATLVDNTVDDASAHRGFAIDVASDAAPAHAGGVHVRGNVCDDVYGGYRVYGLHDATLQDNTVRRARSRDLRFPGVLVAQCDGDVAWTGGLIAEVATVGLRASDQLTATRLRVERTRFRDNAGAHIEVADAEHGTTCALLRVAACDFAGGAEPVVADRVARLELSDNVADRRAVRTTRVGVLRSARNSWDP